MVGRMMPTYTLVCIDPGVHKGGIAVWRVDGRHAHAMQFEQVDTQLAERCLAVMADLPGPIRLWIEAMRDYPDKAARAQSLARVRETVAQIRAGRLVRWVRPYVWKGHVPKHIHHPRLLAQLTPLEIGVLGRGGPDVMDAVGIGLYALRGFTRA
jgi:hypothetical protein